MGRGRGIPGEIKGEQMVKEEGRPTVQKRKGTETRGGEGMGTGKRSKLTDKRKRGHAGGGCRLVWKKKKQDGATNGNSFDPRWENFCQGKKHRAGIVCHRIQYLEKRKKKVWQSNISHKETANVVEKKKGSDEKKKQTGKAKSTFEMDPQKSEGTLVVQP